MTTVFSDKRGLAACAVGLLLCGPAKALPALDVSLFGGAGQTDINRSALHVSAEETDQLRENRRSNNGTFGLGLSHRFHADSFDRNGSMLRDVALGLYYFHLESQSSGLVALYGLNDYPNYLYQLNLNSNRLMFGGQLDFQPLTMGLSPFVNASLGSARVDTYYNERPNRAQQVYNGALHLGSKATSQFAWSVGAGIQKELQPRLSLSLAWQYTQIAKAPTARVSVDDVVIASPIQARLTSQMALLGLTYTIG